MSPVALTEAPLAVRVPWAASPAVVVVVVVVVVPGVVPPARECAVLHVAVVHPHARHGARSPQRRAPHEARAHAQPQRLLAEALAAVLADAAGEAGAELGAVAGGLVAVGVLAAEVVAVARRLRVDESSSADGSLPRPSRAAPPLLLRIARARAWNTSLVSC